MMLSYLVYLVGLVDAKDFVTELTFVMYKVLENLGGKWLLYELYSRYVLYWYVH